MQQPGCPNLYWALTDLPSPLVDLRKGVQGDRARVAADLRPLRDDGPMTEAEMEEFVRRLSGVLGFAREQAGLPPRSLRARLEARVKDQAQVGSRPQASRRGGPWDRARRAVPTRAGHPAGREARVRESAATSARAPGPAALADSARRPAPSPCRCGCSPTSCPTSSSSGEHGRGWSSEVALLRHVEALRLYAAAHDGQLPAKLTDIGVPLPVDPFTGKPFDYEVEGATAHLRGPAPGGAKARRTTSITR